MPSTDHCPSYTQRGTARYRRILLATFLSGLSVFAQLYLFQPILSDLATDFGIPRSASSLAVSLASIGIALGLFIFVFRADIMPRRRLMALSLAISAILTLITPLASTFPLLLLLSLLKGVALSGVSAVALAYLAEEVHPAIIGGAIAVYLTGNNIGGMLGRVASSLLANHVGWRASTLAIGAWSIAIATTFWFLFPPSRNFTPTRIPASLRLVRMRLYLRTPYFIALYAIGFLFMGVFVSVYNYISFRLSAPPYSLPPHIVSFLFLMYLCGTVSSLLFGRLSDRHSPRILLIIAISILLLGVLLMGLAPLSAVLLGLAAVTFAFFASHTIASRMVSTRAGVGRSSASCLYWLFYYLGSSTVGYLTGLVYFSYGWPYFLAANALLLALGILLAILFLRQRYEPGEGFAVPGE